MSWPMVTPPVVNVLISNLPPLLASTDNPSAVVAPLNCKVAPDPAASMNALVPEPI
jgi:hypothetical protein